VIIRLRIPPTSAFNELIIGVNSFTNSRLRPFAGGELKYRTPTLSIISKCKYFELIYNPHFDLF
jgi:hypothetical protein